MSETAIHVQRLSKRYLLGERARYNTMRAALSRAWRFPWRRSAPRRDQIWALSDVTFSVAEGEVVGIIGRNGAGKSTLLKVLSRITEPTKGFAALYGRVGSLLEVGTGFHQELTGRENIFLNGAILGMKRHDIMQRFDEIVAFAGVNRFIDTPVKHYSSGMYLRLAFAVAAHLEPDVLLVDEVLAVGDIAFQRRCLGKMEDIARSGRTVLFVSHNLGAIAAMCDRVILLEAGQIARSGATDAVIAHYVASDPSVRVVRRDQPAPADTPLYVEAVEKLSVHQDAEARTTIAFVIQLMARRPVPFTIEWHLASLMGQQLAWGSPSHFRGTFLEPPGTGRFEVEVTIRDMPLGASRYYLDLGIGDQRLNRYFDYVDRALNFDVETYDPYGIGKSFGPKKEFGPFHFAGDYAVRPVERNRLRDEAND